LALNANGDLLCQALLWVSWRPAQMNNAGGTPALRGLDLSHGGPGFHGRRDGGGTGRRDACATGFGFFARWAGFSWPPRRRRYRQAGRLRYGVWIFCTLGGGFVAAGTAAVRAGGAPACARGLDFSHAGRGFHGRRDGGGTGRRDACATGLRLITCASDKAGMGCLRLPCGRGSWGSLTGGSGWREALRARSSKEQGTAPWHPAASWRARFLRDKCVLAV
jgi:hypothetical protein